MERGILWLTLLAAFIWLGRGGMSIKGGSLSQLGTVERAKYDIYAVLAQNGNLTWGSPTRGPIKLETFSLKDVQSIRLLVDDKPVPMETCRVKVVPSP